MHFKLQVFFERTLMLQYTQCSLHKKFTSLIGQCINLLQNIDSVQPRLSYKSTHSITIKSISNAYYHIPLGNYLEKKWSCVRKYVKNVEYILTTKTVVNFKRQFLQLTRRYPLNYIRQNMTEITIYVDIQLQIYLNITVRQNILNVSKCIHVCNQNIFFDKNQHKTCLFQGNKQIKQFYIRFLFIYYTQICISYHIAYCQLGIYPSFHLLLVLYCGSLTTIKLINLLGNITLILYFAVQCMNMYPNVLYCYLLILSLTLANSNIVLNTIRKYYFQILLYNA
eukprot:TRINITY_DN9444_c1_g1_i5.p1 TRINITY_DN9444_c1_g1~~TRINITY_DN9444_c1_g1_i5.p1  ORF type:complete len:281 (-),score=-37.60 TRINITY_DN9444_c1_g1_i5:425-1267(-)